MVGKGDDDDEMGGEEHTVRRREKGERENDQLLDSGIRRTCSLTQVCERKGWS